LFPIRTAISFRLNPAGYVGCPRCVARIIQQLSQFGCHPGRFVFGAADLARRSQPNHPRGIVGLWHDLLSHIGGRADDARAVKAAAKLRTDP